MSKKSSKKSSNGILAKIIVAALLIAVGVLFIVKRGEILGIAFTLLGAALIVYGLLKMIRDSDMITGLVLIILGILIIAFGWTLANIVCVVAGAALIIYCVYAIVKKQVKGAGWINLILTAAVGVCLVLGVLDASWVFVVIGIMMILYGISFLFS